VLCLATASCSSSKSHGSLIAASHKGSAGAGQTDAFGNATANGSGGTGATKAGASGTGSGTGASNGGSSTCASGLAHATRVTPDVILVVDGSCSMEKPLTSQDAYGSCNIANPGLDTRWGALRFALIDPTQGIVPRLESLIRFGFYLFGTQPSCPLVSAPIPVALNQAMQIANAFPVKPPGSNTPTGLALMEAAKAIPDSTNPDSHQGPTIVLLATDGAPNSCGDSTIDYAPSIAAANALHDKGTLMYVLSLAPATGAFADHLQQMADIGLGQTGSPVYSPNSPDALAADLEKLIGGSVGCYVSLDGSVDPSRACEGTVSLNGTSLSCGTDWELFGERSIRLLGASCDRFKTDASVMLTARFPCGVFTVQ
jgi:Mg-chelatase subunit ChlD